MAKRIMLLDLLGVSILLCFLVIDSVAVSPRLSKPNCTDHCGNISIPFPFGMDRSECFLDGWYEIHCQNGTTPFLKKGNYLKVLHISLPLVWDVLRPGYVTVDFPITYSNPSCYPEGATQTPSLQGSPFFFSSSRNIFAAVGCHVNAQVTSNYSFVGCKAECSGGNFSSNSTCSGFDGCCQTNVPSGVQTFTMQLNNSKDDPPCNNYAILVSELWLHHDFTDLDSVTTKGYVPVLLTWGIENHSDLAKELSGPKAMAGPNSNYGYASLYDTIIIFTCLPGYDGNAYLIDGCHDVNECEDPSNNPCPGRCVNKQGSFDCVDPRKTLKHVIAGIGSGFGMLLLVLLGWWLYQIVKTRKEKKLREKHFKQNGGLMLQQQLLSSEGNVLKGKLFNQKEIEVATENFSKSRVLGKGNQGLVYKGVLADGKIVAIKKALVIDEANVEHFINKLMVLTQISHRNVVQFLGCCLETKIPLLVYEFIPNGNLYEYLHGSNNQVPWEVRLQLAIEIAETLFYLHSEASPPLYHGDIKSTNILLDERHQAKIANFDTSQLISLDQTLVTTLVQGTVGYVDPEYFQTNQFTDKSDVYSFGVVLVELLTRQKPSSTMRKEDGINLAAYFVLSMEDGYLFDILDVEVLSQVTEEEILKVANLAKRCLNFHGRNRPTMKEVTIELEGVKQLQHLSAIQETEENREQVQYQDIFSSASTMINVNTNGTMSSDVQPLLRATT